MLQMCTNFVSVVETFIMDMLYGPNLINVIQCKSSLLSVHILEGEWHNEAVYFNHQ